MLPMEKQHRTMASIRDHRRPGRWTVACAGRAATVALALTLCLMLAGLRPLGLAWLAGWSAAACMVYALDKGAAQRNRQRIPEQVLLGLALAGGSPGALLGMVLFRHKTRKAPFLGRLGLIVAIQGALAGLWWLAR